MPNLTSLRSALAVACAVGAAASVNSCGREQTLPVVVLAADTTHSTASRRRNTADEMSSVAGGLLAIRDGLGFRARVASFGGGPVDVRSVELNVSCTAGARQCSDPIVIQDRADELAPAIEAMAYADPSIGGSDPIGSAHRLLSDVAQDHADASVSVHIWSDFFSRSDVFDTAGTDLSTPEAREAAVSRLADDELDFADIDLDNGDAVVVHLVPAEAAVASTIYLEQIERFVEVLLERAGAPVTVVLSTAGLAT